MADDLRKPAVIALAIAIFSISSVAGQFNSSKARKAGAAAVLADGRQTSRPTPGRPRGPVKDLPFERSVIIQYNSPKKHPPESSRPPLDDSMALRPIIVTSASGKEGETRPIASSGKPGSGSRTPVQPTAAALQPVMIFYRTFQPIAIGQSPVDQKLTTSTPSTNRNAPAEAPSRWTGKSSFIKPSTSSVRMVELQEPTTVFKSFGSEAGKVPSDVGSKTSNESPPVVQTPISSAEIGHAAAQSEEKTAAMLSTTSELIAPPIEKKEYSPSQISTDGTSSDLMTSVISLPGAKRETLGEKRSPSTEPEAADREGMSGDTVALNNSAVHLALKHQYDEARGLLQRAIDAQPQVAKFHRNLSVIYGLVKRWDEALASARTAEKLSPADPSIVEQRCGLELDEGDASEALKCYERLNSLRSPDTLTQTYFGIALFRTGKVKESLALLEKAANSTPPVPIAINALGVAYFSVKRFKEAAAAFKNAVEIAPEMFVSRYNLGLTQFALRNKAGAISQYNILKVENPQLASRLYNIIFSDKIVVVPKN